MKQKPTIKVNTHKQVRYRWRCNWGRYNGYADDIKKAYEACMKCILSSKYWESDMKRYPQLRKQFLS